ncbi:hypothetical protein HPP92_001918 [Vanilla planifolia]|nr:hypothetical protein HPP92_001918 [Vanilla planifolia]
MTQTLKVKVQLKPDTRKPPPDMKDPNPELKIKPVKRTEQVTAAKRNKEVKPHNKTVSPVANSRFPERRANSATRLRETAPATGLVERRRSTSVAKCQAAEHEKGGGRRGELGSVGSTVEKNIKPRRSTATRATASREEKASKFRWV